jgi:RNA polymerase sigma-70 factor (ECF subfamily)
MTPTSRLEKLAEVTGPRVLGYLGRQTQSSAESADIFQQALIIAWKKLEDIPLDDEMAVAWMIATARNCLANYNRSLRRYRRATEQLASEIHIRENVADHLDIAAAMAKLTEADREILVLAYWENLNSQQISTVVGGEPAAVRKRIERARERLRSHMELPLPADAWTTP